MAQIESRSVTASGSTVYESAKAVDEYLQFHFAQEDELAPLVKRFVSKEALDFPTLCAKECALAANVRLRALDVGCAVGGSSFEMARYFPEVVGFDFSAAFIKAANELQSKGSIDYETTIEGTIKERRTAKVPDGLDRSRCKFVVGDACDMPALNLGQFDAVLAANLLCRLPNPAKFLKDVHGMVKEGGVLVLVSPYSWLKEYTEESKWVGGFQGADGAPVHSTGQIYKALVTEGGFELVSEKEMPFLIREHQRKYQIGVSHAAIFRRCK